MGFGTDLVPGLIEGKPKIPQFTPVSLSQSQTQAIAANEASLPALESLSTSVTNFNTENLTAMLKQVIPGYESMTSSISGNIQDLLGGKIPTDVQNAIQTSDAAKAIAGGYSGSQAQANLVARDLGLTSLQLTQQGISSAESWITQMNNMFAPGQFNLSSMFITPQQQFEASVEERNAQFQRDYVANLNDYYHSFNYLAGEDMQGTAQTLLSTFGGMMFGGMGGLGGKSGNSGSNQTGSGGNAPPMDLGQDVGF